MLSKERFFFKDSKTYKLDELEYANSFSDPDRKKNSAIFSNNNKNANMPIVIDYGSNCTKAVMLNSSISV
jgi:activator of 2-hydroxyglutaryl-CoA dehydratase